MLFRTSHMKKGQQRIRRLTPTFEEVGDLLACHVNNPTATRMPPYMMAKLRILKVTSNTTQR